MNKFVHLRTHSEFSITDGINKIDDLIGMARQDKMPAIALTDLNNLFGMLKFYKGARSKGVKPIIGSEVLIENEEDPKSPFRLLILAKNLDGYKRLNELISRSYSENIVFDKACIKKQWLKEEKGLIALSGALKGEPSFHFLSHDIEKMRGSMDFYNRVFPDGYFIEVQRYGHPMEEPYIDEAIACAMDLDIAVVATHPVQFAKREDFFSHDIRVCIAEKRVKTDKQRSEYFTEEQYFKTEEEMRALFSDIPEAVDNTYEIAKMCNLSVTTGKSFLPDFPVPSGMTLDGYMRSQAEKGLEKRLKTLFPDVRIREEKRNEYTSRLDFELETIKNMGFSGYFLIVADFINWGKNNGVPVGPGRGSGAGSLVAYSLGITDLDPLAYSLLFERFLNPERVSMPDFDVDFCQENRNRVIDYVRNKYGHDSVSQIVTFGTMASKAVIKDVGRVLHMGYGFCDNLSKMIPVIQGSPLSLEEALKEVPELSAKYENDEEARNLFTHAVKLEGISKSVGMHAGGVLIAPGKISDFCPLYKADDVSGTVSQFDKDDVEAIGLVKFDFLGLRNLTIIDMAIKYIKERHPEFNVQIENLTFDDDKVYEILKAGNTSSIFQLESEGMKKLMLKLKPDSFEDIIAALALYRPGPLGSGMVDDFVLRKKGKQKIDYFHESLKQTLSPTYGVVVYQEQVMQIAQIIAGYTLGGADMLRRAMGKKKPEEMAKQRSVFVDGALKNGHSEEFASGLFDLMAKFAEYGFNKSHSAAYAVITYQTAWLKTYYCAEFLAATLSSDMADTDKVKMFYDDAIANHITVLPPDINKSKYAFFPESNTEIRYGLGAIKGVGDRVSKQIIENRASGPYKDLFDFCAKMPKGSIDKRIMDGLIKSGAFDSLDKNRSKLLASAGVAIESAKSINHNQGTLFDDLPVMSTKNYVAAPPWTNSKTLEEEKSVLGFYVSGHPFSNYEKEFSHFRGSTRNCDVTIQSELFPVAGTLSSVEKKSSMYILKVDDGTAIIPVVVFKDMFDEHAHLMRQDSPILIYAETRKDNYNDSVSCRAKKIHGVNELRSNYLESIVIDINDKFLEKQDSSTFLSKLRKVLSAHINPNGKIKVVIQYTKDTTVYPMELDSSWSYEFNNEMIRDLMQVCGQSSVVLKYGSKKTPVAKKRRMVA